MNVLVDTNVLLRAAERAHPMHSQALAALAAVPAGGDTLCVVPQVLYEFRAVASRPTAVNGLGLTPAAADAEITRLLTAFPLLADTPAVFPDWRTLVATYGVAGKVVHDARLVAAMRVHGVTHLLTFNVADFVRFPVTVLDPAVVAAPPTP